jgi:hypothetical protein
MEIDSMPQDIDVVERKLMQLEIERQALKKERDDVSAKRLTELDREIAEMSEKREGMRAQWLREKERIDTIRDKKAKVEQLRIDPVQSHGVTAPDRRIALAIRMKQVQHPALADHRIVVDLLFEPFPQPHRQFVEGDALIKHVIGSDNRRIAACIAAADPSFLENRYVGDAVDLGKIMRRGEAMSAAADDDDIIARLWRRIPPSWPPMPMAG